MSTALFADRDGPKTPKTRKGILKGNYLSNNTHYTTHTHTHTHLASARQQNDTATDECSPRRQKQRLKNVMEFMQQKSPLLYFICLWCFAAGFQYTDNVKDKTVTFAPMKAKVGRPMAFLCVCVCVCVCVLSLIHI